MSKILVILSSINGAASRSSEVALALADGLKANDPGSTVTIRDVVATPPSHITGQLAADWMIPADQRTAEQHAALAATEETTKEVLEADHIIIASSMINFGIGSGLKAWFDHLIRFGVAFGFDPVKKAGYGLITGRKFYLVVSSGGVYSSGPAVPMDFQMPYLKALMTFIGATDVEEIRVEGLTRGPEAAAASREAALARVAEITARSI